MTVLSEREERLVRAVRSLPEETRDQVLEWTTRLAELAKGNRVEWSDTWSEEDMQDATAASLRRFDETSRDQS